MIKISRQVYVEKKSTDAIQANDLYHELKINFQFKNLSGVRLLNKYDVNGIDQNTFTLATQSVFSEPQIDIVHLDKFDIKSTRQCFAFTLLPGQYDQRADSAQQCIKLLDPNAKPIIRTACVVVLDGELSENEINQIKKYCINPVDSCEINVLGPIVNIKPPKTRRIDYLKGFIDLDEKAIKAFLINHQLAMSIDDLIMIRNYFRNKMHDPTMTEIKVIDTY
jgi:phosphoribosylformylglycinamidine synthase